MRESRVRFRKRKTCPASLRAPCGFARVDHSTVALSLSSCCDHTWRTSAAWPDQVLCKQNKRNAINEQQRKWMEQREQALPDRYSSDQIYAIKAISTGRHRHIAAVKKTLHRR